MNYLFNIACSEKGFDNAMSVIQFTALSLVQPARQAGHAAVSKSLVNASQMADSYRAITRLSLLLEALSPTTLSTLKKAGRYPVIRALDVVNHAVLVAYCILEHLAVLGSFNILPNSLVRLDGCAVVCWFYNLLLDSIRAIYLILFGTPMGKLTFKERRRECLSLIHSLCFLVFSMTCVPQGGPQLLDPAARSHGALAIANRVVRLVAPQRLVLGTTTRGLLGLLGTIVTFL